MKPNKSVCIAFLAALAIAAPAQACQLLCFRTNTSYDGNLGGLSGADAKCAAEFGTGWKFPRAVSEVLNSGNGDTTSNTLGKLVSGGNYFGTGYSYGWIGPFVYSATTVYNCANWTSNVSGTYGGEIYNSSGFSVSYDACSIPQPIICCNM